LTVGEAEVDKTLEILRKQRTTYEAVQRPAAPEDRVSVDFTGRIDEAEFPGGKGTDVQVVLGEGRMLPDFEKQLVGASAGESKSFDVQFPEDYRGKEVAGKTARFDVTVKTVEAPRVPALDAELAKALGVADGDLAKMREEVKANVEREVRKRIDADLKQKVMQALIDSTPVEVPKALLEVETHRMVQAARADLESRGIKIDKLPINPEAFEQQAHRRVALGLVVGELLKSQGLAATPDQVRALVEDYAQSYEQPSEMVRWLYSESQRLGEFEALAAEANVVKWVLEHANVQEKAISFDELMNATPR
jgi:trigger factor